MKTSLICFAFLGIGSPRGCQTIPPPVNVASAPALAESEKSRLSLIGAHAEAGEVANAKQPPGLITQAVAGPLSVIRQLAGPASDKDRAAALALVNAALTGRVAESEAGWMQARADATALTERLKTLEAQVAAERIAAATELKRQLEQARDEARAKAAAAERSMIGWIFYGGAALCLALGATAFSLIGSVPIIGPNVARGLLLTGVCLGFAGVAINQLLAHPWVVWVSLGSGVAVLIGTAALMYANHHHAQSAEAKP
jgi:hypothetical protein